MHIGSRNRSVENEIFITKSQKKYLKYFIKERLQKYIVLIITVKVKLKFI